ncbi:fumarate hydratase [Thermodesulfobacteriota bacterium]
MKEIDVGTITEAVRDLCIEANYQLGEDVLDAFEAAMGREESTVAMETLREFRENARIASEGVFPMCQDTGFAVLFIELGQEVTLVGGDFNEAAQEGVRQGYGDGYLRKSICDPFTRKNTGDNTPAVVHVTIVPGDGIRIIFAPKGGGSENMSRVTMLVPAEGVEGVKNFVIERVRESGANPCPPIVVGIGIGGTFEMSAILAKKALLRPIGSPNRDMDLAILEEEILDRINELGIGPAGYGGRTTALAVHIEYHPCHIASLPVAVNINCHASRHKERVL